MSKSRKTKLVLSIVFAAFLAFLFAPVAGAADFRACQPTRHVFSPSNGTTVVVLRCDRGSEADGKLVAVRLNPDGSRDATYGSEGAADLVPAATFYDTFGTQAVLDPQGRLLLSHHETLVRLDQNGHPDTTFGGGDGRLDISSLPGLAGRRVGALALDNGSVIYLNATGSGTSIVALDDGGSPDPSLNEGQPLEFSEVIPSAEGRGFQGPLAFTADGSLISGTGAGLGESGMVKISPAGDAVQAFGTGGQVVFPSPGSSSHAAVSAILPREDGSLVVGLYNVETNTRGASWVTTAEFTASGQAVRPFAHADFGFDRSQFESAESWAQQGDRTYLALSMYGTESEAPDGALVGRLLPDGTGDPAFGDHGLLALNLGEVSVAVGVAATPAGGAVVAAGASQTAIVRLDDQGRRDMSFGKCGVVTIPEFAVAGPERPLASAKAQRRGKSLRLQVKVRTEPQVAGDCPWSRASLRLPNGLRIRPGAAKQVKVFAKFGKEVKAVPGQSLQVKGRTISVKRPPAQTSDKLWIRVRPSALKKIPKRLRGRRPAVTSSYFWPGVEALTGKARFRVPRR